MWAHTKHRKLQKRSKGNYIQGNRLVRRARKSELQKRRQSSSSGKLFYVLVYEGIKYRGNCKVQMFIELSTIIKIKIRPCQAGTGNS